VIVKNGMATVALLGAFALSGCATTKTYQDAGVYKGENYLLDVTWEDGGFSRTTYVSVNGDRILTIDRESYKAANCQQTSYYVSRCVYNTEYEGRDVEVVATSDGQIGQQNTYYSISFEGTLIRRMTVPFM
jgi:hypothetical protein